MATHPTIQTYVQDFLQLLNKVSDDKYGVQPVMDFLIECRHDKQVLPMAEFITILKYKKPFLFYTIKSVISSQSPLHLIMQFDMDYDVAMNRLGIAELQLYQPSN
ncbi:hypothetical protein [Marinicrinis sediminis]|uniref:Uncharacterized protein n=1 Tax=Marinicrinis sediminis TaxID=1652465 RepID=A0ABW5REH7_9BACL